MHCSHHWEGWAGCAQKIYLRCYSWFQLSLNTSQVHRSLFNSTYRIVGNFWGSKLSRICEKYNFCWESFCRMLAFAAPKNTMPQISQRKTFAYSHKTTKFTELFSLKRFRCTVIEPTTRLISHKPVWSTYGSQWNDYCVPPLCSKRAEINRLVVFENLPTMLCCTVPKICLCPYYAETPANFLVLCTSLTPFRLVEQVGRFFWHQCAPYLSASTLIPTVWVLEVYLDYSCHNSCDLIGWMSKPLRYLQLRYLQVFAPEQY